MSRKEFELMYDAFKNYHIYMTPEQKELAEQLLNRGFYNTGASK
tara:strand:- start:612 stop:743 length:132 start_codon:yes stop_codon:yes gene_type:complete